MNEVKWVEYIAQVVRDNLRLEKSLEVAAGLKLAYGYEITSYANASGDSPTTKTSAFQTDLAIIERGADGWIPRVVVEAKLRRVSSHAAITYSHKAGIHRAVHPYLRYGIMLGDRKDLPLPGRLYRHGAQFDFMFSFKGIEPEAGELRNFINILRSEIKASKALESILYESRKRERDRYTVLHRKLVLK